MAKLTVNPSTEAVAKAAATHVVTDERGRSITLKKPSILAQFRLVEVLGDTAKNEVYTAMALPLIFVVEIDGDPVAQPSTKRELEALIQRLDDAGVEAVQAGVHEHFGSPNPEGDKAAIKN